MNLLKNSSAILFTFSHFCRLVLVKYYPLVYSQYGVKNGPEDRGYNVPGARALCRGSGTSWLY